MASLLGGFSCVCSGYWTGRMTCHRRCRRRACLPCVPSGDSSGYYTERRPGHTGGRNKAPRCVFSCESSSCLTGKSFHTWSRGKESCHCGFFGVSSSYWSGRKICHKPCRGRAVSQNGSDCVTLSLKSKNTTPYIFCSHKAPLEGPQGQQVSGEPRPQLGRGSPAGSVTGADPY